MKKSVKIEVRPPTPAGAELAKQLLTELRGADLPKLPQPAVDMLKELMDHNDKVVGRTSRFGRDRAREALKRHFKIDLGHKIFDRVIKETFGRPWAGEA